MVWLVSIPDSCVSDREFMSLEPINERSPPPLKKKKASCRYSNIMKQMRLFFSVDVHTYHVSFLCQHPHRGKQLPLLCRRGPAEATFSYSNSDDYV